LRPASFRRLSPSSNIATPEGKFVVRVKGGTLHLVSWSSQHKSGENSAARIGAIITGEEASETARRQAAVATGSSGSKRMLILLGLAILAVNSFTLWFVTRPKKTLLPQYVVLPAGPAERLLTTVAGVYETGSAPGDRRIEIDRTGIVQRYKFGDAHAFGQQAELHGHARRGRGQARAADQPQVAHHGQRLAHGGALR